MRVCQSCGATNETGREICTVCGSPLNSSPEDGLSTLRRLTELDHVPVTDDVAETVPDWLELLLAKHGEEAPMLIKEELTAAADEGPALARSSPPAGQPKPPTEAGPAHLPGDTEEVPDWVTDSRRTDMPDISASLSANQVPQKEPEDGTEEVPPITGITDELEALRATLAESDADDISEPSERPPEEEGEEVPPLISDTGEIPGWVRELGLVDRDISPTADKEVKPPEPPLDAEAQLAPAEVEEEGKVPEWLGRLVIPEPPEQEREEAPIAPEKVSEQPLPLEGFSVPEEEIEAVADAEIPTWLAELGISEMEAAGATKSPTGELPDWLHETDMAQSRRHLEPPGPEPPLPATTEETAPSPPGGEQVSEEAAETEEGFPDWLADLRSASTADTGMPAEETEIPDHLSELQSLVDITQDTAGLEPEDEMPPSPEPQVAEEEIPDWLRELSIEPTEPELPSTVADEERPPLESSPAIAEELALAEIPEWVAKLKPEGEAMSEPRELKGAMEEVPEMMPIADEPSIEEETIEDLRARLGVLPQVPDVEGAALAREIASEQPELPPVSDEESRRSRIFSTIAWVLIFLVLILGIIVSLLAIAERVENLLGGPAFHRFLETPSAAGLVASVQTFRDGIMTLSPGSVVLVCFDYSPATEAEMGPLAETVMRDLLNHQARVITVSLQPEGAAMAQRLLERFESDYPYGQRTVNLGYLPGQTAGVRSLAFLPEMALFHGTGETLNDYPAWQDVKGLDDVVLVVEVADSARAVRWWVEQAPPSPLADRPMLAAVSASAAPTIRPYHNAINPDAGQLQGMISGVTAAAAYEVYLGQPGRATRSLAAQSAAHLGLVVVGLAGASVGFTSHTTKQT